MVDDFLLICFDHILYTIVHYSIIVGLSTSTSDSSAR